MSDKYDLWNPCVECGAHQLKPFVLGVTHSLHSGEYLVYNEPNDEWNIAQFDGATWVSTVSEELYPVTHYQELPGRP